MAKQSLRIEALKAWLKERNPFEGLSKPEKVDHNIYNPNVKIKGL